MGHNGIESLGSTGGSGSGAVGLSWTLLYCGSCSWFLCSISMLSQAISGIGRFVLYFGLFVFQQGSGKTASCSAFFPPSSSSCQSAHVLPGLKSITLLSPQDPAPLGCLKILSVPICMFSLLIAPS